MVRDTEKQIRVVFEDYYTMRRALEEIAKRQGIGVVCSTFASKGYCEHASCRASEAAYNTAHQALRQIGAV